MNKDSQELSREREQRVMDAIGLKIPDRVPVVTGLGYFVAKYAGITCQAAWYDYDKWLAAYKKTLRDIQPDMLQPQGFTPGKALEHLKSRTNRWPGYGASPNHCHQAIEIEVLKENEYDLFLNDPGDYMFRLNLGRVCEDRWAEACRNTGPGRTCSNTDAVVWPDRKSPGLSALQTGRQFIRYRARMTKFNETFENLGLSYTQGSALAPFDAPTLCAG
jgi:hypothetical protein